MRRPPSGASLPSDFVRYEAAGQFVVTTPLLASG